MGGELVERLNRYAERLQNGESIEEPGLGADLADAVAEIERLKAEHSDGCVAVAEFDRLLDRAEQAEAEIERLKARLREEADDNIKLKDRFYQSQKDQRALEAEIERLSVDRDRIYSVCERSHSVQEYTKLTEEIERLKAQQRSVDEMQAAYVRGLEAEVERLKAEHSDGCVAVAEFDRLLDRAEQAEAEVERLKGEDKRWRTLTEYDSPECAKAGLAMREARLAQANAEVERLKALPTFSDGAKGAFEWQERAKRAEAKLDRETKRCADIADNALRACITDEERDVATTIRNLILAAAKGEGSSDARP